MLKNSIKESKFYGNKDYIYILTNQSFPNLVKISCVKDKQVFKLKFKVGEFDMVIFDPLTSSSEIFEIKHSKETHHSQYRFLVDEEKLNLTRFKYGEIKRRCVIYNGISHIENDIEYINVDEYLLFNEK